MSSTLLERHTVNGWNVELHYDPAPSTPRDWVHGADMVLSRRNWDLPNDAGVDLDDFESWAEVRDHLLDGTALAVLPVYMMDHGGIALSTGSFHDPWDSGQLGVAYVTPQNWAETQGEMDWTGSPAQLVLAQELIKSEVEVYGQYLNGEVYGYRILDPLDGEEQESLWGLYGYEYAMKEAAEAAEGLEHEAKCTGTLNRRTGKVEHAGACPLHPVLTESQVKEAYDWADAAMARMRAPQQEHVHCLEAGHSDPGESYAYDHDHCGITGHTDPGEQRARPWLAFWPARE